MKPKIIKQEEDNIDMDFFFIWISAQKLGNYLYQYF